MDTRYLDDLSPGQRFETGGIDSEGGVNRDPITGDNGQAKAIKCAKVEWTKDTNGAWKMNEVPGSEFELKADLILLGGTGKARKVELTVTVDGQEGAALGVMQPILAKEMSWTAMDYANINFWFQVGYAIGFVLQGRLIDRVGVKRVFFCAVLLWSLATGAHGLATSAVGFMVCRFILGLTEAANYPACVFSHQRNLRGFVVHHL